MRAVGLETTAKSNTLLSFRLYALQQPGCPSPPSTSRTLPRALTCPGWRSTALTPCRSSSVMRISSTPSGQVMISIMISISPPSGPSSSRTGSPTCSSMAPQAQVRSPHPHTKANVLCQARPAPSWPVPRRSTLPSSLPPW